MRFPQLMNEKQHDMVISSIELFAGVGMLGEGVRAGLRYMGFENRTVCYVEREAYPASVLASRMEEKSMDAAPIWSDVCTFDATAWRGRVDCIVAGFPCQDLSIAGRRAGLDGKRSGLFFEIVRIAEGSGAWFLVLENVAGIATATASVMDETEGVLDERAAARVVGELADRGWDAEWINLSASDVGASHGRARWFCVAWRNLADAQYDAGRTEQRTESRQRNKKGPTEKSEHRIDSAGMADAGCGAARGGEHFAGSGGREAEYQPGIETMADSARNGRDRPYGEVGSRRRVRQTGIELGDTGGLDVKTRGPHRICREESACRQRCEQPGDELAHTARDDGDQRQRLGECKTSVAGCESGAEGHDQELAIAEGIGREQGWPKPAGEQGRHDAAERNGELADANSAGLRTSGEFCCWSCDLASRGHGLFAPGPSDENWGDILARSPWYRPALSIEEQNDASAAFAAAQSVLWGMDDGLAAGLDFNDRTPRLKCVGNGVVALCAATAFVVLARRAGLFAHEHDIVRAA